MRSLLLLALLCPFLTMCQPITIKGKVINISNEPIPAATITLKRTGFTTTTDANGNFTIHDSRLTDSITVSSVGYIAQTVPNNNRGQITIILHPSVSVLDEAVVIAYGTTTRRLATGNISRVTANEIEQQPVMNVLNSLHGRVPGLIVTQSSGVPGSSVSLQLRGRNSLTQGTEPLFVIDGVPFAPNNNNINQLGSAASGLGRGFSPFYSINPADIESIEVLKDADATAIYGSRGASGVILITTKKAKAGKTRVTLNYQASLSSPTRLMPFLNTEQYISMRRTAFANDNITPTLTNAPDLLIFDTIRYTDFSKNILANNATSQNMQASVSGGTSLTKFTMSASYNTETTIYANTGRQNRYAMHGAVNHTSPSQKLNVHLGTNYSSTDNNLLGSDISNSLALPPNYPALRDSLGNIAWQYKGHTLSSNPMASLMIDYNAITDNLLLNTLVSYKLLDNLTIKTALGYNTFSFDETHVFPMAARNPATNPTGTAQFANRTYRSWSVEPYLEHRLGISNGILTTLLGFSAQQLKDRGQNISATGYTSDALIYSLDGAAAFTSDNHYSLYRYNSVFGRLNYNWTNKYILNFSARRDGSSRFGPGKRFGNFASAAFAWIFTEEKFIELPLLSFGKLRTSYGSSGNDQIGNYQYLDSWSSNLPAYNGINTLAPARLFNSDYSWETTKKLEAAIDLGFFDDRFLFSAAWFQNRSSNQLISYALPAQTGFLSVLRNFPAEIQNSGWELSASANWFKNKSFEWTTAAHITLPKNKLLSFPGIESSSYAATYKLGQPLSLMYNLHYIGLDSNGVYKFEDVNKDGLIDNRDYLVNGNTAPEFYGGLSNTIGFKGFALDIFFEYRNALGRNYRYHSLAGTIGGQINLPLYYLDRWPNEGADLQKLTTLTSSPAGRAQQNMNNSDGSWGNASYIRLKNLALSYNLAASLMEKWKMEAARFFILAQNLATITPYKGADPETQSPYNLPPLKTFSIGLQLTF